MATVSGPASAPGRTAAAPTVAPAVPARTRPARISVSGVSPATATAAPATGLLAASHSAPVIRLTPTTAPQPGAPTPNASARTFRTRDGKEVELPEGMTVQEAARLEADAIKAQSQLGKGPPPQPVPDVKQQARKETKKTAVKPKGGVKVAVRRAGGSKRAPPPPPARLRVGAGKVAQYLAAKALPVQQRGLAGLRQLRQNEQTHEDAGQKLQHSEKAVVNPPEEGQSKSSAGQVDAVVAKPTPAPNEDVGKRKLQASLHENAPKTIEDVDNFKRDRKGQHIGADVLKVVQGDTNAVGATFGDVKATPPPAPPEQTPQALPPIENAPATASLALGQNTIAPLPKEHTDVSQYTQGADDKLKEEGVTQEQLDMVDSGDLAAANREKKGMEKTAKTEPLAIQQFAQQENTRVGRELGQEEKKQRGDMQARRKAGLGATAAKQKGTKSALEKKREEVAKHINGIYTRAQNSVKQKLADLETTSMKRFDDGNAQAAKDFEANVNREIDAFKADRYSGWFGWARRAKDWLLGIDDLPEVKAIFERNRTAFVNTINKLVEDITADNKKVIQGCKEELANARKEIEVYVKGLGPQLRGIGKQAAAEMNAQLADLDGFINKKEEDLQNSLKDKQTAAIKAIDEKIEKMKEAMSGALAKLGKLLLLAAKKFFAWALEKFGYSLSDIQSIIDKGVAVLKAIFTKPIVFVKNLMKAAMLGFEMFRDHFLDHLKNALFEWLTGSLEGIQLPATWDLKGIIGVALQIVGITYTNLRRFLVEELTEPVVVGLEKGASLIATLFREGPLAAWEQLKGMAAEISAAFQAAVKDYIKEKIIIEAVKWVVSLFIPGGGIIKAIIGIYDTIVFFVQKIKQIMKMIASFLSSIGEIAAGNIGAAAKALENGLARGLTLVISFLAQLLHLSGITNRIKAVLAKIRGKVDGVLKKLAHWIAMPLKKVYAAVKGAALKGVQKIVNWWRARKSFRGEDGKPHELLFAGSESSARLMVKSDEMPFGDFVARAQPGKNAKKAAAKKEAVRIAALIDAEIKRPESAAAATSGPDKAARVNALLEELAPHTALLFGTGLPDSAKPVWGGLNSAGFATSMSVKPLTQKHVEGTPPTKANNTVYAALNERRAEAGSPASYYIKGHLLNQNLGGPGDWDNLTPLSRSGNAQHETQVESTIKRSVDLPGSVEYSVKPVYGRRGDKAGLLAAIHRGTDTLDAQRIKSEIVEAEDHVPSALQINAWLVEETSRGQFARKGAIISRRLENPVERAPNSYFLSSSPKPKPINLSTSTETEIAAFLGPTVAHNLVVVRRQREKQDIFRWQSYRQIADLVPGIGEARLQALAEAGHVSLY